jgi:hypothetical protein
MSPRSQQQRLSRSKIRSAGLHRYGAEQRGRSHPLFMPMPPDNQANGAVWNTDNLPWFRSRYTSTFQYNHDAE